MTGQDEPQASDVLCPVFWGSHGCDLPRGHSGTHHCACCECEDHVRDHLRNFCAGEWPYYGPDVVTRLFTVDPPR